AIDQRQQDDARGLLQRRILIQLVEDECRLGVALEIDHQPNGLAVARRRLVADLAHALDALVLDQLADLLRQTVARLLIRHLADDDLAAVVADLGATADGNLAAATHVAIEDALLAADDVPRGEVRSLEGEVAFRLVRLHELLDAYVGVVDDARQR